MKKISSKIIAALVAVLIMLPAASASAETNTTGSKFLNGIIKQQQKTGNAGQKQQIKQALAEKRATIKKNHETNAALREEIAQKKSEVKTIYKDIKTNNIKLTQEDLAKVADQIKAIQAEIDKLQATRGDIKKEFELVKDAIQKLNVSEASAHLDKIISIQNTRTEGLKDLGAQLDTLIDLLKAASQNGTQASGTDTSTQPTL